MDLGGLSSIYFCIFSFLHDRIHSNDHSYTSWKHEFTSIIIINTTVSKVWICKQPCSIALQVDYVH